MHIGEFGALYCCEYCCQYWCEYCCQYWCEICLLRKNAGAFAKAVLPAGLGCAWRVLCRAGRTGAHSKEVSVAVRAGGGSTAKPLARQMVAAHGDVPRTAESGSRRRSKSRTATALPCILVEAHGKEPFAGPGFAVRPLPSADARQSLCRAYIVLCRAFWPHGKARVSRSGAAL